MGLLGYDDQDVSQGLLSFGQMAAQRRPFLGLLAGLAAADRSQAGRAEMQRQAGIDERKLKLEEALKNAQMGEIEAQRMQRLAALAQAQQQAQEQERIARLLQSAVSPVRPIEANAASGITGPRPEALASVGQRVPIDFQSLLAQGVPADRLKSIAEAPTWGLPKVARTEAIDDERGGKAIVQLDEFGRPVGRALPGYVAPVQVNQGDKITFAKPQAGLSLAVGMSPIERDASARGWANVGLSRERLNMERANAGQLVETPDGFVRVVGTQSSAVSAPGGGPRPLVGKGQGMTEDQAKATGWLVQATNAYSNMQKAIQSTPDASRPGFNDFLAAVPSMGLGEAIGNKLRGEDRQRFMQGASSLSEALLRAATGAGVNQDEAAQKVRELTPQFGDSEKVIEQKMAAIPLYIETLKVRAGPGAKQAGRLLDQPMTRQPSESDPLGLFGGN